jgi:hydroxymethylbilane synthase
MNQSNGLKILKMGTRRSLLALAQSGWVAREIERTNPGIRVETVGIDTRGDKILDVPLTSVQGKEFFVAELDDALRSGRVDFTVHSMKDLSLDRPEDFVLGAVPIRENLRDILLFSERVLARLSRGEVIRIGTSSPRRLENLPGFLSRALPHSPARPPRLEFVEIRGNVNTRLSRVHEPDGSERQLDGVVLAVAGLNRLFLDETGRAELERLLVNTRPMLLPVTECPAAAAQGALAVECRRNDSVVQAALSKIHHEATRAEVARERAILQEWGGGCHQRFGASAIEHAELGILLYIKGRRPSGEEADEIRWNRPRLERGPMWDGSRFRASITSDDREYQERALRRLASATSGDAVFVAHHRAVIRDDGESNRAWSDALFGKRIWVSGAASWFAMAGHGFWVEGCAEGFGAERALAEWTSAKVLQLPAADRWWVLTHAGALESDMGNWKSLLPERRLGTYVVSTEQKSPHATQEIRTARNVFWASGSQWSLYGKEARSDAIHACGAGKTAAYLRKQGLKPVVFPNVGEWRKACEARS